MIPIILILVFFALGSFYYLDQKARIRREQSRERFREKQQQLVDLLKDQSNSDKPAKNEDNIK